MRRTLLAALSAAALALSFLLVLAPSASAAPPGHGFWHRHDRVCAVAPAGQAACNAIRNDTVDSNGHVVRNVTPSGYGPADLRSAYGLTTASSGGKTVAIIDAYDDPYAESDLGVYRKQFGIPACTTSNGCFKKVGQTGTKTYPRANGGWSQEISLDLDMVSATCPDCHILLVEAKSTSFADLGAAVQYAGSVPGVVAISNSYGGSDSNNATVEGYYRQLGKAVVASTGDSGYGVQSPASFPTVIAAGGTSLTKTSNGWTETAWSGAGSGCSALNPPASWQDTSTTSCNGKANADVSAVADPSTGVAVYDSYSYGGARGWLVFGGTSAAAPIVASVYAMGPSVGVLDYPAQNTWAHRGGLNDVTGGSNGTCTTAVWCQSGAGWDGPTGLGTPNGTSSF